MKLEFKLKYIPNILSLIRLLLVGVFIAVFFGLDSDHKNKIALLVFVIAGITDVIDGFLARRFGWITTAGKILDPLADKLMQCTVLICLALTRMLGYWYILPYILKELALLFCGLLVIKKRSVVVVSNIFGKFAAFFFYVVIGLVMLLTKQNPVRIAPWVNIICAISLFFTLLAFAVYFIGFLKKDARQKAQAAETNSQNV